LFIAIIALAGCEQSPGVTVNGELLIGKYVGDGVATFLGIPFAEPPVGDLRWRAPQPLTSKLERRETTEFAAACMQTMRILDWYKSMAESFGASANYYDDLDVSEDCLYLNVWTPTLDDAARLPVMVWVHGGSNKSGWSYEDNYRGHVLAPQGVIVVTVGYRQGVFGFLSHPELESEDAVANFGLWDLVAALQWIQDNISGFGGDPSRVTLFGEHPDRLVIQNVAVFIDGAVLSVGGVRIQGDIGNYDQLRVFGLNGRNRTLHEPDWIRAFLAVQAL